MVVARSRIRPVASRSGPSAGSAHTASFAAKISEAGCVDRWHFPRVATKMVEQVADRRDWFVCMRGPLAEGVGQSSEPAHAWKINDLEKAPALTV
jgi:hypothetical protein